jgi:hypothetical protein
MKIGSETYVKTVKKLKKTTQSCLSWTKEMFLQHDDAAPHTSVATSVAIESIRFEFVPHLSTSLDLALSDFGCLQLSRHFSKEFFHIW